MATTKIPAELVAVNAIQGTLIADNAITAVHIATNAVSGTLIADNALTAVHIATDAVTPLQIQADAVTAAKLATNAVVTASIVAGSVTTTELGADAVTNAKIADDAIDSEHYTDGSIDAAHLADDAVTIAKMAALPRGKIIAGDASGAPAALALGSANQLLQSDGTDIVWSALNSGIDDNSNAIAMTIDSNEKVLVGGTSNAENGIFQVFGAKALVAGIPQGNLTVGDSTAIATGVGGAINFIGKYTGNVYTSFSSVEGYKDNGTDGQYGGSLVFKTRTHGSSQGERMRIDSTGNVGIGTSSPLNKLDVDQTLGRNRTSKNGHVLCQNKNNDSTNYWTFAPRDGGHVSIGYGTPDSDGTVASHLLAIETGGNVGIGTASPDQTLQVAGNIRIPATGGKIAFGSAGTTPGDYLMLQDVSSGTPALAFVQDSSTKFVIDGVTGNVGIANDDPSAKLHLGSASSFGNQTDPALQIGGTGNYRLGLYTTAEGAVYDNKNGDDGHIFLVKTAGEAMRIDGGTGNVGIGTTGPEETLSVIGDMNWTGQMYAGSGSSRRPFAKQSYWGYSSGYRAIVLGSTSTAYNTNVSGATTLCFNYDPVGNSHSGFGGNGEEIIFRNPTRFMQPNDADTNFHYHTLTMVDGKIGIGTAAPSAALHVYTSASTGINIGLQNSERYWKMQTDGGYLTFNDVSAGDLARMVLSPSGANVGIGTTDFTSMGSSSYKGLKVGGGFIQDSGGGTGGSLFIGQNAYVGGSNDFKFDSGGTASSIQFSSGDINFYTFDGGGGSADATWSATARMHIKENGNIGIRTTSPGATFDIGGGDFADPTLLIHSAAGGDPHLDFDTSAVNRSNIIRFRDQGSVIGRIQYKHNGDIMEFQAGSSTGATFEVRNNNVWLNATTQITGSKPLQFDRRVYHQFKRDGNQLHLKRGDTLAQIGYWSDAGAYTATSDSRLKENITTITGATAKVKQLRGVTHTWKAAMQNPDNKTAVSYGLIAQEVEAVVPEVVSTGATDDAYKGIQYDNLIPLLIETIKELEARITTLEG